MPAAPSFSLPLKPRDRPVDLPEEYTKTLRNEYQVRYLESIGASPSRANMALVRKHMPIENCHFTTAWKSRGWMADTLYISLEPPASSSKDGDDGGGPSEDSTDPTIAAVWQQVQQAVQGEAAAEEEDTIEQEMGAPRGNMRFEDAQRSFLYPYKLLPAQLEKQKGGQRSRPSSGPAERGGGGGGGGGGGVGGGGGGASADGEAEGGEAGPSGAYDLRSRDLHKYPAYTEEELRAELQQQLRLHTKDIVALQVEFCQTFPFERVNARLSAEQNKLVLHELLGKPTARFIGLLSLLLYWTHMSERQTVETAAFVVAQPVTPSSPGGSHWLHAALHTPEEPLSDWARCQ